MSANLTMKDIAQALGLSVSTVSRALNDSPSISKEVGERVRAYAKEHHFTINRIAVNLRQTHADHPRVIGVIVPELAHFFFSSIMTGVIEAASERGYYVMVAHSGEHYTREKEICEQFDGSRVCGVIVSLAKDTPTYNYDHFRMLQERGIPLVFCDRICTGIEASRVVVDDYQGAFNAVSHLIATGCRRIAFYGMNSNLEIQKNRYNGYRDALLQAGLTPDSELSLYADTREKAESITPGIMNRDCPPDAFFAVNDDTAIGILYAVKRMGLRIPDDVAICGFTNGPQAVSSDPMLTTVEQRGREVGRQAAMIVIDKVEGRSPIAQIERRVVKTRLVERGTTHKVPTSI